MSIDYIDATTVLSSGVGSFAGAGAAFCLSILRENSKQFNYEKNCLTRYLYNLNYALRNISICYKIIDEMNEKKKNAPDIINHVNNVEIPTEYLNFDFNETELSFLSEIDNVFYENILQLRTELKIAYNFAVSYSNLCSKAISDLANAEISKDEYAKAYTVAYSVVVSALDSTLPKVIATIQNVDNCLISFYKNKSLIKDGIKDNVTNAQNHCLGLSVYNGWRVNFDHIKKCRWHIFRFPLINICYKKNC